MAPSRVSQSSSGLWARFRALDSFQKVNEDFFTRTASGGVVTLVASCCMLLLFLSELRLFLQVRTDYALNVDTTRGDTIQINLDVTFPRVPCSVLSLDVMDVSGEEQLDVSHNVFKRRLESDGSPHVESPEKSHVGHDDVVMLVQDQSGSLLDRRSNDTYCGSCYGAEQQPGECCNSCAVVRERYRQRGWAFTINTQVEQCKREAHLEAIDAQSGEGCRMFGHFTVNKVAGNFHFAPGKSFQQGSMHVHDLLAFGPDALFNMSHTIHKLSFGADYPGLENPLDGVVITQSGPHLMYQYFVKVVPTVYIDIGGDVIRTAQFSVTEHAKSVDIPTGRNLPGLFCFYDVNPIQVRFMETKSSFTHFLTSVCAIVGGVFTVSGLVDSFLYHGQKVLAKKRELGKLT